MNAFCPNPIPDQSPRFLNVIFITIAFEVVINLKSFTVILICVLGVKVGALVSTSAHFTWKLQKFVPAVIFFTFCSRVFFPHESRIAESNNRMTVSMRTLNIPPRLFLLSLCFPSRFDSFILLHYHDRKKWEESAEIRWRQ